MKLIPILVLSVVLGLGLSLGGSLARAGTPPDAMRALLANSYKVIDADPAAFTASPFTGQTVLSVLSQALTGPNNIQTKCDAQSATLTTTNYACSVTVTQIPADASVGPCAVTFTFNIAQLTNGNMVVTPGIHASEN